MYKGLYFLKEDGTYRNEKNEILSADVVLRVLKRRQAKAEIVEMKDKPVSIKSKGTEYVVNNYGQYMSGEYELDPILVLAYLQSISDGKGYSVGLGEQQTYDTFIGGDSYGGDGSGGGGDSGGGGGE